MPHMRITLNSKSLKTAHVIKRCDVQALASRGGGWREKRKMVSSIGLSEGSTNLANA